VSQADGRRAPTALGTRLLIDVTAGECCAGQYLVLCCKLADATVGILYPAGCGNCKSTTPTTTIISSQRMQMPHLVLLRRRVLLHAVEPCALLRIMC
jgi:hypothetical protein